MGSIDDIIKTLESISPNRLFSEEKKAIEAAIRYLRRLEENESANKDNAK